MVTVAKNMVDTLAASGVERVYGIPGDSLNGFTDALRESGIEWVHVRHEEAAAFAASTMPEVCVSSRCSSAGNNRSSPIAASAG